MGAIFNVFPLLLIPVLIYNIWAFASTAAHSNAADVRRHLETCDAANKCLEVPMASSEPVAGGLQGAMHPVVWEVSFGTLLVVLSLFFLFIELLKSSSTNTSTIFNHALSMLVFIICLVEFLLHPAFATSTFFIIMTMALLDVLAGVVVTIISARRDVEFSGHG